MSFEVFTAVLLRIHVMWDVTPVPDVTGQGCNAVILRVKYKVRTNGVFIGCAELRKPWRRRQYDPAKLRQTTRRHTLEDWNVQNNSVMKAMQLSLHTPQRRVEGAEV